jgi:hypothetical protein
VREREREYIQGGRERQKQEERERGKAVDVAR